jgi:hypothetical protein
MITHSTRSDAAYRPASYALLRGTDKSLFDHRFNCFERCDQFLKEIYSENLCNSHEALFEKVISLYRHCVALAIGSSGARLIPVMTLFTGLCTSAINTLGFF